jgi:4-hydroxy-tetrahydrodipicolinate synthase
MAWSGVFPAVTTKLKADGKFDPIAMEHCIERLIANGVSGLIVLPMLGENASLSQMQRDEVLDHAVSTVAGRVPLLSGLAATSQTDATFMAKNAQKRGLNGLMVFPSLAYKTDRRETVEWYTSIGAASDLPIMIYNNPIAYKVDVDVATLEKLTSVDTIVCIKEETGDTRRVTDLYNAFSNRFAIFCGIDDLILESLALGVTGWVSGMTNVWPKECVSIFDAGKSGKFDDIRPLYQLMTPAFHLDTDVKLVQYIKLAEHLVYGAPYEVLPPRLALEGDELKQVTAIINKTISDLADQK